MLLERLLIGQTATAHKSSVSDD